MFQVEEIAFLGFLSYILGISGHALCHPSHTLTILIL